MRSKGLLLIALLAIAVTATQAFADADGERDALGRLAHEIEALAPLVAKAGAQAEPDAPMPPR